MALRYVPCPYCGQNNTDCERFEVQDGDSYNTYARERWFCNRCGTKFSLETVWKMAYFSYGDDTLFAPDGHTFHVDTDMEYEIRR